MISNAEHEISWKKRLEQFRTENETETDMGVVIDYVTYYPTGAVLLEDGACNRDQAPVEGSLNTLRNQHKYWSWKLTEATSAFHQLKNAARNQIAEFGSIHCEHELEARQKEARRLKRKLDKVNKAINNHPDTIAEAEKASIKDRQREQANNRLERFTI